MDTVKANFEVRFRNKDEPDVVEVYFFRYSSGVRLALVPVDISDDGVIIWKDTEVPEGTVAPVSLHLSSELFDALKKEIAPPADGVKELIEVLKKQLLIEQARVNRLIDNAVR